MKKPVVGIVGGGMVGGALAALLGQQRSAFDRVVLIEAGTAPVMTEDVDLRVVALSAASQAILDHAGAWDAIAAERISPYREMMVWDAASAPGKPGSLHFSAAELAAPALGHIVENQLIRYALWQQLEALDSVEIQSGTSVTRMVADEDQVDLTLDDGGSLSCDLVVAADGARSPLREMLGIKTQRRPYHQKGVVTNLRCERDHKETAWQRFLAGGPLAFLPLADGRCSIVWSCEDAEAERLLALDDTAFLLEVEAASDHVLGAMLECGPRAAFPLHLLHADEYCRQRIVLVGDAAHSIHPLAGQGVNLGLLDAAALAETIEDAIADGRDIGDRAVLRCYERWRKGDNLAMLSALDGINRLFKNPSPAAGIVRGFGLSAVNALPAARKLFMRRAMGVGGDMPRAASTIKRHSRAG